MLDHTRRNGCRRIPCVRSEKVAYGLRWERDVHCSYGVGVPFDEIFARSFQRAAGVYKNLPTMQRRRRPLTRGGKLIEKVWKYFHLSKTKIQQFGSRRIVPNKKHAVVCMNALSRAFRECATYQRELASLRHIPTSTTTRLKVSVAGKRRTPAWRGREALSQQRSCESNIAGVFSMRSCENATHSLREERKGVVEKIMPGPRVPILCFA